MEERDTKQMILEKSAELFNMNGYDGCSLSDIMKATGLQKGGIYNYFKNKEEIAIQAFDYSLHLVIQRFRVRLDKDTSAWDKLNSVIETMKEFYIQPVIVGGCPIFNTVMDSANTYPSLLDKAKEGLEMLIRYVELKIQQGINSGEFYKVENTYSLASHLVVTMEGALVMSRVFKNRIYVEQAGDTLISWLDEKLFQAK